MPVTHGVAGSSPVRTANITHKPLLYGGAFFLVDQPDQPGQLGLPDQPNQLDQVGSAVQKLTAHVFVEAKVKAVVLHQVLVGENLLYRAAGSNGAIVKNAHPVATGYQGKD